jgi:hypothetical protein
MHLAALLPISLLGWVGTPYTPQSEQRRLPARGLTPQSGPRMMSMPWSDLRPLLDDVPLFVVVDEDRRSRQRVPGQDLFFVDPQAAQAELEAVHGKMSGEQLTVQPVSLGFAYERARGVGREASSSTNFVAAEADVLRAPLIAEAEAAGIDWSSGTALPIFFCFQLQQRDQSGQLRMPLFFSARDADVALAAAERSIAGAGGKPGSLKLQCTSLSLIVQRIVDGALKDSASLLFVPSREAVRFCRQLEPGTGADASNEVSETVARQALTTLLDEGYRPREIRDTGLFPS